MDLVDQVDRLDSDFKLVVGSEKKKGNDEKTKQRFGKDRRGNDWMSRFEYSRLVEMRARMLDEGAVVDPMVSIKGLHNSMDIAEREINYRHKNYVFPLRLRRPFPGGIYEIWTVEELILPRELEEEIF